MARPRQIDFFRFFYFKTDGLRFGERWLKFSGEPKFDFSCSTENREKLQPLQHQDGEPLRRPSGGFAVLAATMSPGRGTMAECNQSMVPISNSFSKVISLKCIPASRPRAT
jgi:hypothetical protein